MTLLLIDDDLDILQMTGRRLKRKNFNVLTYSELGEAEKGFLESQSPPIGIICDLFLKDGENGMDFYDTIRNKHDWKGPFILSTGDDQADARIIQYNTSDPYFKCLQKPFPINEIIDFIDNYSKKAS